MFRLSSEVRPSMMQVMENCRYLQVSVTMKAVVQIHRDYRIRTSACHEVFLLVCCKVDLSLLKTLKLCPL
jgi:hypothetical protein